MLKPAIVTLLLISCFAFAKAQDSTAVFTKELTFITENDNYNFTKQDRYYSNGIFLRYQWLGKQTASSKLAAKLHRIEAGHMIYNPHLNRRSLEQVLEQQDRPYAGWLYASYGQTNVLNDERVLQFDGAVGILGPAAKGKEVQTNYHNFIGLYKLYGWENQLLNEAGVNASLRFYQPLMEARKNMTLHATGKATLGNTFTNASAGVLLKVGKLEAEQYSAYWTSRLGQNKQQQRHQTEFIFFLEPTLMAQAYNATVQGGMFRKDKGNYTSELNPFIYLIKSGIILSNRQTSFSAYYHIKQREAKTMIDPFEVYGAFAFSIRFR
ncbi:lipid A deacylase LpxR family protein [Lacibacter sp. H407]|uniref:lipid A deacylase LpxR family protein n=1 Tax=Lacibacter sp. H407 TaxID=3133423 RepID=UPI0030BF4EBC